MHSAVPLLAHNLGRRFDADDSTSAGCSVASLEAISNICFGSDAAGLDIVRGSFAIHCYLLFFQSLCVINPWPKPKPGEQWNI